MNDKKDVRWLQRFEKYCRSFDILKQLVDLSLKRDLYFFERIALIKSFEFIYELSWNVLRDFLRAEYEDEFKIQKFKDDLLSGSRDVFLQAKKYQLVTSDIDIDALVKNRNKTVHTYNENMANKIAELILNEYYQFFEQIRATLLEEKKRRGL